MGTVSEGSEVNRNQQPEIGPDDFYYEGRYMVFTAAYLLKRGYCCNSGCRHCPYGDEVRGGGGNSLSLT